MASLKRRSNNHFINENGENLFELALRKAAQKEGYKMEVTITAFDGSGPTKGIMIGGKDAKVGHIGVEYHNRWCFYYYDYKGKHFLAHYINGRVEFGSGIGYYQTEYDAITEAIKNCGVEEVA